MIAVLDTVSFRFPEVWGLRSDSLVVDISICGFKCLEFGRYPYLHVICHAGEADGQRQVSVARHKLRHDGKVRTVRL